MNTDRIRLYQHRLVETIRRKQALSDRVAEAFQRIPRHPFVSHYYTHTPGTREWIRTEQNDTAEWYEQVYQDQGLVTCVDEHGRSLSSSSQPSIMASMLEVLDLQWGMRVLEIGTGTGYNAGLLTALTGDPHLVTTIDIDEHAVIQARRVLAHVVGEGVTVIQGDGAHGYSAHAPYDRIIVTASTPTIPHLWATQLAPHGILVGVLQPTYAMLGGLVKAEKHGEQLQGRIWNTASFMILRDAFYAKRRVQISWNAPVCESFHIQPTLFPPTLLREDPHFAFFFHFILPDIHVFQKTKEGTVVMYQETSPQGYLVFRSSLVDLHGEVNCARTLWNRLVRLYAFWLHCGQPKITQYHFEMNKDGRQTLFLKTSDGTLWPFES